VEFKIFKLYSVQKLSNTFSCTTVNYRMLNSRHR